MSEEWLPWDADADTEMYGLDELSDDLTCLFGNFDTPEDNKREREKGE